MPAPKQRKFLAFIYDVEANIICYGKVFGFLIDAKSNALHLCKKHKFAAAVVINHFEGGRTVRLPYRFTGSQLREISWQDFREFWKLNRM